MTTTIKGKYRLEKRLANGGMAEVFVARVLGAEGFSRQVAVKRVLPHLCSNPAFANLFIEEARLTSELRHSNLVSVLDFERDDEGSYCLVMELVEGRDLDKLIDTGPLPFALVIYLAIEILRGLDYIHELPGSIGRSRGIVHRDISPHNILLAWDGGVKLADFGVAKAHARTVATASLMIKGKPAYMSPEQARGYELDGRSDLFAVGVMLFRMLCLKDPFLSDSLEATLYRLINEPIPHPRALRPEIPEDLAQVVLSLLQRVVDQRMPTAAAAITALVACEDCPKDGRAELTATLAERFPIAAPVRARPHTSPTIVARKPSGSGSGAAVAAVASRLRSAPTRTAVPIQTSSATSHLRRGRRGRLAVAAAAGALVLAVGVGIVVSNARSGKSSPSETTAKVPAASTPPSPSALPPPASTVPPQTPATVPPDPAAPTLTTQATSSGSAAGRTVPRDDGRAAGSASHPSNTSGGGASPAAKQPVPRPVQRPSSIRAVTIGS